MFYLLDRVDCLVTVRTPVSGSSKQVRDILCGWNLHFFCFPIQEDNQSEGERKRRHWNPREVCQWVKPKHQSFLIVKWSFRNCRTKCTRNLPHCQLLFQVSRSSVYLKANPEIENEEQLRLNAVQWLSETSRQPFFYDFLFPYVKNVPHFKEKVIMFKMKPTHFNFSFR